MSKIFDDSWIKKSHESTPQDWFSIVTTPALNTPVLQTRKKNETISSNEVQVNTQQKHHFAWFFSGKSVITMV